MDRHTCLPALKLAFALAIGFASGCGGRAHQTTPFPDDTMADAGDAPSGGGAHVWAGKINEVPAGEVFVGGWIFDSSLQRFRRPVGCKEYALVGEDTGANRRLSVAHLWLQRAPVSNGLYALCFDAGVCSAPDHDIADPNPLAWDDPARAELPVYTRHDQAAAYCKWVNGRLPTVAELSRAAQGDAEMPGVAALTQAVIDCAKDKANPSAICGQLSLMNYFQSPSPPLYRTGGVELDEGPFGHVDLFGSVWEWTRTFGGFADDGPFCALKDGGPDFVTFDPDQERGQSDVLGFASVLIQAVATGVASPARIESDATNRYNIGFRCAFDDVK